MKSADKDRRGVEVRPRSGGEPWVTREGKGSESGRAPRHQTGAPTVRLLNRGKEACSPRG
jgi:hypothetical protein